jgi:hypothetical protein
VTGSDTARALACIAVVAAVVGWVRALPAQLHGVELRAAGRAAAELRDAYRFRGDDGREHAYLGGFDGYAWAIAARKLARGGSVCDEVVDGVCRDLTSLAPAGRTVRYPHSLHVRAIAAMHRVLTAWRPQTPLLVAAAAVSTVVALLATVPCVALGCRLAGWLGGLIVGLLSGLNPFLLRRTLGGDNDVWSFFFPVLLAWLVVEAILARRAAVAVAIAAAAGLLVGPYSSIWNGWPFAWSMAAAGLLANAILLAAAASGRAAAMATVPMLSFLIAAGVSTALAGASPSYFDALPLLFDSHLLSAPAAAATGPELSWPDPYADVRELRSVGIGEVADWLGGRVYLFAGWIGLLLMLMPRRGWRAPHFVVFLAGILLCRVLLATSPSAPSRLLVVAALAAPLVAAVALYAYDPRDGARRRASISIVVWFVAALYLGLGSVRFLLLLVPPFAVAIAVVADRLRDWVFGRVTLGPPTGGAAALASLATAAVAIGALWGPLSAGWATARHYLPQVNDAWYTALTRIGDEAPADAIVSTWWPFGYYAGYFAERRVTADGGTLYGSAPYWLARAMMAPSERESAGFLRLLHCGGAAGGTPEASPQFAPLAAAGLSPRAAIGAIEAIVRLGRGAARRALRDRGLAADASAAVLAVTHCDPPPSYLVLSDLDGRDLSWQRMAGWSFARAFAAGVASRSEAAAIAADLHSSFALAPAAAREVAAAAVDAAGRGRLRDFPLESRPVAVSPWSPCRGAGASFDCPLRAGPISGVELRLDDPAASRLLGDRGQPLASIVVAGPDGLEEVRVGGTAVGLTVLFDRVGRRAALGSRAAMLSTWARLMLLDGRYGGIFEKASEGSAAGERVAAWRVRWRELDEPHG